MEKPERIAKKLRPSIQDKRIYLKGNKAIIDMGSIKYLLYQVKKGENKNILIEFNENLVKKLEEDLHYKTIKEFCDKNNYPLSIINKQIKIKEGTQDNFMLSNLRYI